ncbi:hypothetical protein GCM10010401_07080 [Rarobacter faecitabidus]|uniref:PDDEXK-like uncharacterized protein DUF3799 n=1 Tax=Rarobacter faecitabidus TaxID=13243 RepID=A0A542ZT56_RARFA|nr:PD-(D/E)XK nuclease-like domain-containing protein [Rarobacter faecitabidus]TQL63543.1 PDDEXK-like uncharacterized protein DUF3799 [Rarobacter faecitabidus]
MSITEPGIYDLPELEYHADPIPGGSFSSTMAKQILKSPAHLRHYLDSPRVEKKEFDFGHIVHGGVLGVGLDVEVLDFDDYRTKAAREARDRAYAAGRVPIIERDYEPARDAIEAVKAHPIAWPLFAGDGLPERSAFAVDPSAGLWLRGRFDWITPSGILVDLKTTTDGAPFAFDSDARKLRYYLQAAFYMHVYQLATGDEPRGFMFVTVEKSAPHLVDAYQVGRAGLELGAMQTRRAIDTYKRCLDSGEWPGRPAVINELNPPLWAITEEEDLSL